MSLFRVILFIYFIVTDLSDAISYYVPVQIRLLSMIEEYTSSRQEKEQERKRQRVRTSSLTNHGLN